MKTRKHPSPAMPPSTATIDAIERQIRIADLALASARAALAALRHQTNAQPRDEIGRFARAALDRDGFCVFTDPDPEYDGRRTA